MDETISYVSMLRVANEILNENHFLEDGDFYCVDQDIPDYLTKEVSIFSGAEYSEVWSSEEWEAIKTALWLPRLDQLFKMIDSANDSISVLENVNRWMNTNMDYLIVRIDTFETDTEKCIVSSSRFTSMEQLVLAYIMDIKYNKRWNGEQWIIQ